MKIIVPSLGAPTRSVSSQPSRCARRWSPGSPTSALTPRARTCAYLRPPPHTCVPTYVRTHLRRHRELGKTKPLVEIRDIEYSYSKNLPQLEEKNPKRTRKKYFWFGEEKGNFCELNLFLLYIDIFSFLVTCIFVQVEPALQLSIERQFIFRHHRG